MSVECEHPSDLFTVAGSNLMDEKPILKKERKMCVCVCVCVVGTRASK